MIRALYLLILLYIAIPIFAQSNLSALIPMPNHVETGVSEDSFKFKDGETLISATDEELSFAIDALIDIVQKRMGIQVLRAKKPSEASISLEIDHSLEGREHYTLSVNSKGIVIKGATSAAVYYGVMTLDQILLGDQCSSKQKEVASIRIDDEPRFGYRALMLDPARNFLPVEDVKFFIDQMAKYKFNVLQLHLTDDQGWRIEIKKHPKLASEQHYTHKDIEELVDYAAQRHVDIVPEIDVPGHTAAILDVYPELICSHRQGETIKEGKTTDVMLCAAKEPVYTILKDVILEISELFPFPYFHLGGDEAAIQNGWAKCDDCSKMMHKYGYKEISQLMIPFFNRVLSYVRDCGKKPILWCELNSIYPPADDYLFPYPEDVTLVSWRGGLTPTCQALTFKNGHPLIMAPGEYTYLDYPQLKGDLPEFNNWGMPVTTLERSYQFDPGYNSPLEEQSHILGVMGTLWAEAMKDINRVTYMAFPRAFALSEAGWTEMDRRDWSSFKERLYPNLTDLMKCGVSVRVPFEIVRPVK